MHPAPKVSVIVCTYNQEHCIGRALDSILRQKVNFPYEIILADDCSSDGTPEVCKHYRDLYPDVIRLFLNSKNKGVVDNYFDCIKECRGAYIADLAGDDEWIAIDKLQKQVEILDSDRGIVMCHAGWKLRRPDGSVDNPNGFYVPNHKYIAEPGQLTTLLLMHRKEKSFIHLCTAMYRRDTVMNLMGKYPCLFRNKMLTCEDLQLNVMLSHVGRIAYIPDTVLLYSVGMPSVSSSEDPLKTIRFYSGVIRLTSMLADILGIDRNRIAGCYHDIMQFIIMKYFISHDMDGKKMISDLLKEEKIPLSLKNRVTLLLSSNALTWRLATAIRSLLKE